MVPVTHLDARIGDAQGLLKSLNSRLNSRLPHVDEEDLRLAHRVLAESALDKLVLRGTGADKVRTALETDEAAVVAGIVAFAFKMGMLS